MIERNVHHPRRKFPTRTCLGLAHDYTLTHGGKWAIKFQTWVGCPGEEHMVSEITSGALFDSEDAAYEAGLRALTVLEETGMFPNLCEVF